jgi:predicted ATPase
MAGEAGGNPFLLVELLEGLRQEGLVRVDSGRATLTVHRLPDRVRASMRERLARMSDPARQLATVAGSLGRTFSVSELSEMLDLPPGSLVTSVEELIEAGIIRERGDELGFQHDLIREAVRGACAPSARRALDRQAADVMLRRGGTAGGGRDSARGWCRGGGRSRGQDAAGGRRGFGDDRTGSERGPQPAGAGAGT